MNESMYQNVKKRILIIDDDYELAFSLREVLVEEGYEVDVAGDGREGIRLQNSNPYQLVITDIIMPLEDGLEVIMWIREAFPSTHMIAISGGGYLGAHEYLQMAKELGASVVLNKPFEASTIITKVKDLLSNAVTVK